MKDCRNCHTENSDSALKCKACGYPLFLGMQEECTGNGIAWLVDGEGVLTIRKSEDGDGTIRLKAVTDTVNVQVGDKDEGIWEDRERILYYEKPWKQYEDLITEARIGEGITEIPDELFSRVKGMKRVQLPSTLKTIRRRAFSGSGLEEIVIPQGVEKIEEYAFEFCDRLKTAVLPDSLSWLGYYAFHGCRELREISIPNGERVIRERCFWECKKLEKVHLPDNLRAIGEAAFFHCEKLSDISLPAELEVIENFAFADCPLESISLPEGLTKIGDHAFSSCPLGSVTIPYSVTSVGKFAFSDCREAIVPKQIYDLAVLKPALMMFGTDARIRRRREPLLSFLFKKK